ncbi:SPOR domain-containing protein [Prevotella sp. E2-28]|uniref:SPOR domain-containing protein n=1 Tax=Prevotella sp. E2-28 TaxID=2913620 RepID=UPI001EDBA7B5|nr:SPOR domain-containing protein [Prevotella sp. E2-28]UKK54106.1 SPOR domain-containing protein [Prevotella sp. E2-28]
MKTGILQPIIKKVLVILPFYLFTFLPLTAQTFTQNIQKTKTGEGTITIHQDTAIDELVNGPVPTVKQKPTIKKTTPVKPTSRDNKKDTHVTQEIKDTIESLQEIDSLNNTPKRTFKAIGYRVQVLAGGNTRQDRQRAEQAGRSLRSLFPGEEVYVHFYSPRWICRLGNYRTYDEAHEKLLEVRKMGYEAATIVKGKITLTEEIK